MPGSKLLLASCLSVPLDLPLQLPWPKLCHCEQRAISSVPCLTGKTGSKAGRGAGNAGVKRAAEVLFHREWEIQTEASEPALSETSALPATTEASVRCESVCHPSCVCQRCLLSRSMQKPDLGSVSVASWCS